MALDLLLGGGRVVDGTGAPAVPADVGIRGDRIEVVGDLTGAEAADRLDVGGCVVAPGFVDVHTHTDVLAWLPDHHHIHTASVLQGVTTEICGNCGFSPFPADPAVGLERDPYLTALGGGVARAFETLADYRAALGRERLPVNRAPLIGHATLRAAVVGYEDRAPTADELEEMRTRLARALDEGAVGLSTGLVYPPGQFADTDELAALAEVVAARGGIYTSHLRDEIDAVSEAVTEAIEIGRRTGVAVQISHHKVAGRVNRGHAERTLSAIARARDEGVDVAHDVYPYTAASTLLAALLPPWANTGDLDRRLAVLRDPEARRRMARDHEQGLPGWQDFARAAGWDQIVLTDHPVHEGRSIAGIAAGRAPYDVVCDLLLEYPTLTCVLEMMAPDDVEAIDAQPFAMTGSDGLPAPGRQHPRVAGAVARVVGRAAQADDLAARVRRLTSLPAGRFGLTGRGVVRPGAVADLVVLDPTTVADRATYADPWLAPAGIRHVVVAGGLVVRDAVDTGRRPGRVLGAREPT